MQGQSDPYTMIAVQRQQIAALEAHVAALARAVLAITQFPRGLPKAVDVELIRDAARE